MFLYIRLMEDYNELHEMKEDFVLKKNHPAIRYLIIGLLILVGVLVSNLYLQWCQNNLSTELMFKFAFSWHVEKFFLGCFVLLVLYLFLASLSGSLIAGAAFYGVFIGLLGYATYLKMLYRQEPIYPDDLKMVTQFGLLKEMIGTLPFVLAILAILSVIGLFFWQFYQSLRLTKQKQLVRITTLLLSSCCLLYISHFNSDSNLLRKAYNRSALWIPYSQKMNYYNTGFVGGFLYNFRVEAMTEPENYSKETIEKIVEKYQNETEKTETEQPNIVYVMSESFSDPSHLNGIEVTGDPLADYYEKAQQTYSGKMLSQNYGGGTANIEFEALTSFSMELFNSQMTTPYTMLVPKMEQIPSLVSLVKERGYETTAIHPYDTSMYKRKDVYEIFGFDQFLDQDSMDYTDTIENNPYISDESAYHQVMNILENHESPQFIHLVTMQTHMPYQGKYSTLNYGVSGAESSQSLKNYLQDVAYSSQALKKFLEQLETLPNRTVVVFWGDHLPGIYSDELQAQNEATTLRETEFLMWDSANHWSYESNQISSPFYFAPNLFSKSGLQLTPFYELLLTLEEQLPAFEKGMYFDGEVWNKELALNQEAQEAYEEYRLIQYDIVEGDQYSLGMSFFDESFVSQK